LRHEAYGRQGPDDGTNRIERRPETKAGSTNFRGCHIRQQGIPRGVANAFAYSIGRAGGQNRRGAFSKREQELGASRQDIAENDQDLAAA